MTQNNKPEWFEITDADEKPELRKVSKSLPVSAVLVAALILGVGAVTAQTQGVTPLSAPENNPTAQAVSAVKSAVANPTTVAAAVVGTVATSKLANPAISKLPTGGNDDDDDHGRGHDDDDEDEDDDDEEGDDD